MVLRFLTAGESHGPALTGIMEGLPAGIRLEYSDFTELLARRWRGYGRSPRKNIEPEKPEIVGGVYKSRTTGAPFALIIRNSDFEQHRGWMSPFAEDVEAGKITAIRPGHADLAGALKYHTNDLRSIRERASARETAMRTALSVPARNMLASFGVRSLCLVESLGGIRADIDYDLPFEQLEKQMQTGGDEFLCPDEHVVERWRKLIDEKTASAGSVGGTAAVVFYGLPVGLGSHVHFDRRLDSIIAGHILSIPAIKGVAFGLAASNCNLQTPAIDSLYYGENGFYRKTNFAAGLEGGITNGQPLIVRFHVKAIPSNMPFATVDIVSKKAVKNQKYRSDIQAVTAAAVVAESVVSIAIASEFMKVLGGDNFAQMLDRYHREFGVR